ncbi:MAG: AAA family ATPase [Planctomycetota bacterium]
MISSVEITRFRGIREGKLDGLTPLVVLVGPNGSGKSSVIDALLIAGSRSIQGGVARAVARHEGLQYGARWLFWRPGYQEPCEIKIATEDSGQRTFILRAERPDSWDPFPVRCQVHEVFNATRTGDLLLEFGRGNKLKAQSGGGPGTPPEVFAGVQLIESHREGFATALHELTTKTTELGVLDAVRDTLAEVVPGVTDIRILTEGNDPLVHIVFRDHSVPAALAGDGVYSLLRCSLEIASRPGGTILMEEPEVHQHPGAIRQTMQAIVAAIRRDIQVIMTTHSLELIDALLAEATDEDLEKLSLYRLALEDGLLISHRIPGAEVEFARMEVEKDLR